MKQQNFVWQARFKSLVSDEVQEATQLIAAQTLRKALVKAEKFIETAEAGELTAIIKQGDVVI